MQLNFQKTMDPISPGIIATLAVKGAEKALSPLYKRITEKLSIKTLEKLEKHEDDGRNEDIIRYAWIKLQIWHLEKIQHARNARLVDQQASRVPQGDLDCTIEDLGLVQDGLQELHQQLKELSSLVKPMGKVAAKMLRTAEG